LNVSEKAPTLPLLLMRDGGFRYYSCSFAEWGQPYSEGRDHWNKRDDVDKHLQLLSAETKRIETGKGRYKAYHMPVFYRVAPFVRWWAVGDAADVQDLLSGVSHIGKKRMYGWGSVLRWEVEEVEQDHSLIWDGKPQRSLPVTDRIYELVAETRQIFWGYYPPYYDHRNQAECYLPSRIRLAEAGGEG